MPTRPSLDSFVGTAPKPSLDSFVQPVTPTTPVVTPTNTYGATFPASSTDTGLSAGLKATGNLPSSFINLAKSFVNVALHPINTIENVGKTIYGAGEAAGRAILSHTALADKVAQVPANQQEQLFNSLASSLKDRFGSLENLQKTATNDPVGFGTDIATLLSGGAALLGKTTELGNLTSKIISPITKGTQLVTKGVGTLGTQILGAETGAGASSIKSALSGSEAFAKTMRGNITPEETLRTAESAFNTLKQNRVNDYTSKLSKISKNQTSLNISPINNELDKQLGNFKVNVNPTGTLDFSRSTIRFDKTAQGDIQNIYDTMKGYGTKIGDRTPLAVDSLKRAFGDLYSNSSNVRSFIQSMKDVTRTVLNKNVAGYETMTKGYQTASDLINEVKSATSLGKSTNFDTVFTKLTTALKSDKEFRLQMLNELQNGTGQKLVDALAGHNMSKWIPSGLVGKGLDVGAAWGIIQHVFTPQLIPLVLTTSPRIMGEFLNAVGVTKNYVSPILDAINKARVSKSVILSQPMLPKKSQQ